MLSPTALISLAWKNLVLPFGGLLSAGGILISVAGLVYFSNAKLDGPFPERASYLEVCLSGLLFFGFLLLLSQARRRTEHSKPEGVQPQIEDNPTKLREGIVELNRSDPNHEATPERDSQLGLGDRLMQAKDWFIVGARLTGLWVFYTGILYVSNYIELRLSVSDLGQTSSGGSYLVHAAVHLGFALFLLLRAEELAQFLFAKRDAKSAQIEESNVVHD